MGSSGADSIPRGIETYSSEANIEIKIKTLDSQTYTMRVDKQMPIPALKEQIASVTGVLSEQQRLICRGKVLKDDQLLSAYHVEDGHTLHMVVRQPLPPSPEGLTNNSATDPASGTSHGQMAPSFVIEAFTDHGEGVPPEISRFLSAVLGSIGIPNFGSGSEGSDVARDRVPQRASTTGSAVDTSHLQPSQAGARGQSDGLQSAFGLPAAISLGSLHPPVISDSLTTLSHYLAHMKREFDAIVTGRGRENNAQADTTRTVQIDSNAASESATTQASLPTPASLAEMLLSSRQVLIEQVAECLHQLARQIESQADVTDSAARLGTQSSAWRTGVQLHNLGAFLLELGRTTMTLRLGQAPSDALVNAGPAVFINQSGPNPLMVQPLPFQSGSSFGTFHMGAGQPGSGLVNGIGTTFLPRRIDIQIRRGSSAVTANNNSEERGQTQHPAGQANPVTASGSDNHANLTGSRVAEGSPFVGESGVRVVPIRTVIAAVPRSFSRLPSDSSGNSMGLYHPLIGRYQHAAAVHASGVRGSQGAGEHHSVGVQNDQQPTTEPTMQHNNVESRESDGNMIIEEVPLGSMPTPNLRQEPSVSRSININILSAGGIQNNQESDRQIPNSVMQLLRALFPGGEVHVDGANLQGTTTNPVPEHAGPSTTPAEPEPELEPRVTDEGIFLSTLLREIMPLISQSGGTEARVNSQSAESSSQAELVDVGTSRRHSDTEPGPPHSKRQKME